MADMRQRSLVIIAYMDGLHTLIKTNTGRVDQEIGSIKVFSIRNIFNLNETLWTDTQR